jgi:SAM-dependent methyltransferase
MKCRYCNNQLQFEFIDLTNSPPSNSYITEEELNDPEVFYPLKLYVCHNCFLVQIDEYKKSDEIFNKKYIYFSSFSKSLLDHSKKYVNMITERFTFENTSLVIEIASNDGYLLQYFKEKNIRCVGIEPSLKTAEVAKEKGIEVIGDYFGYSLAKELANKNEKADLLIGNNVLAHVPNIRDFVKGLKAILKDTGIITMEFTHLMQLIDNSLFDLIYHEHFSYLSLLTVKTIFESFGLELFDVEEISTQGGSLRIYAKHNEDNSKIISKNVQNLLEKEISKNMNKIDYYLDFPNKVNKIKYDFLQFLIEKSVEGKKVIGYGAAAKGNTLLNYCGVKKDLVKFVVDLSPYKQKKFLPGSHIPVVSEQEIKKFRPDFIIIFPWNIKEEIMNQLDYVREWGCSFVIPLPRVKIL